nr:PREDICTED: facilitated trehalose transporter Tret1-like [Bemisia tabaci]
MFLTPGVRRQLAAALTCSLCCLITELMVGWAAPSLKKLREPDSPVHLTRHQEAWVVNAMYYGNIVSPLPSGFLINLIGRKTTLLIVAVLPTVGWILIYFSTSATMLMVARFLYGLWTGVIMTTLPIYTGEISEPHVRGVFGSFFQICNSVGSNLSFLVAPYVSIQTMAVLCGSVPIMFIVLFSQCPESPYYYVMKKRPDAAARSLFWLRGGKPVSEELQVIQTSVANEEKHGSRCINLSVPATRKAFVIVVTMNILQRLSGISFMKAFSSVVMPRVGILSPDHCTIIMGVVWTVSSFICTALIDRAGRKPLLYASSLGIFVSMLWTSVWFYLNDKTDVDVSHLSWLPLAGVLVYGCTFSFGLGPITKLYPGEMFPSDVKGQAAALTVMIAAFSSSVSTGLAPILNEHFGVYSNFLIFSLIGLINLLFTYFCVVETKGKSLQLIQAQLRGERLDEIRDSDASEKHA